MLVTLRDVLPHARQHHYAIPAFDVIGDVMVRTILDTAEAEGSPVILMCLEHNLREPNGYVHLAHYIREAAKSYSIPVVLHLDHALDVTLVEEALAHGFTSVMIDGSQLSLPENIALTSEAVKLAAAYGASVEAELGHVGGHELGGHYGSHSQLTDARSVQTFIEATACDALAVSIGTAHGVYHSEPSLHIERLQEINAVSSVPLVLHGGSGTPDDQLQRAIQHGISKVNIYADCRIAMAEGLKKAAATLTRQDPLPEQLLLPIREALQAVVTSKIYQLHAQHRYKETSQ
ncbi:ketose-bisphosphate aldolase [Fictibacillus macauensis ZFHKF-1]|uniref:Ketose-bisphosphate aldolase n=1 Tax=Fictibacillus macauensis ZFHKF-1 TaxID=1196324 RepID=I8AFX8_9BACL|nr:class II fructose-bisphosphate aldolase [Fictibacillus macauensis]EIT84294.1 ketose-bisphosphate aldolase [Fictibacillus macauensis ZFHKF-1]